MGGIGSIIGGVLTGGLSLINSGDKEADAIRQQAQQQEAEYQQKLLEQQEAAILEGANVADSIADITVGNSGTYADDPFYRKKKGSSSKYASNALGL